ncbi:MAG: choice-of-anchor B family protein [Myxococcota bacterium]|nr:choice-of-anchor B family protein [Myxococcota bacterium]
MRWAPLISTLLLLFGQAALAHDQIFDGDADGDGEVEVLAACESGAAFIFECSNVDLIAWLPNSVFGESRASDIWGWHDHENEREYALIGLEGGTAFVDVTDPADPVYVGTLPAQTFDSTWRDMKTYNGYAFIVSEAANHGLQIFDMRQLAQVSNPPVVFAPSAHYAGFGNSHNLALNEETATAYAVGTSTCNGGLHMVDVSEPLSPRFAGCFAADGYTHDAQCVVYHGSDEEYAEREICFNANEDTLTIADVTNRDEPRMLSRNGYSGSGYSHQGWLTEDHRYFLLGDEFDEGRGRHNARTYVWDLSDLEAPFLAGTYTGPFSSIDHNVFVSGNHAFEANYLGGLRIIRLGNLDEADMAEVAFFDTTPLRQGLQFSGAWGVYPFLESGVVLVSDINNGLFILGADLEAVPECNDGIDNDSDGLRDFPEDPSCEEAHSAAELPRSDVAIDVRIRFRPKRFRSRSRAPLRVAVLGSESFDVRDIDRETLRFGPGDARPKFRGRIYRDVNGDDQRDLVAFFRSHDAALTNFRAPACLSWSIQDGTPYRACAEPTRRGRRARHRVDRR